MYSKYLGKTSIHNNRTDYQKHKIQYLTCVFITQSYFAVEKNIKLKSLNYSALKSLNKQELQEIPINQSFGIDFKNFIKFYKKLTAEPSIS